MTVSPLNETNQFVYDGNHNLILSRLTRWATATSCFMTARTT